MHFHIVTPSFNQAVWLRLCLASVRDQIDADLALHVHHHVQDGGSTDETLALLKSHEQEVVAAHAAGREIRYTFSFAHEPDDGMYDAINRGWQRAGEEVDIVAHLNCDEQYLPGALEKVAAYYYEHPRTECVFGDVIVVDSCGAYRCSRKVLKPQLYHTHLHYLGTFTAGCFFRRRLLAEANLYYETQWQTISDAVWVLDLLRRGINMGIVRDYLASFTDSGDNLALSPQAIKERAKLRAMISGWIRWTSPFWLWQHRLRRLLHGCYRADSVSYSIYTAASPCERVEHLEENAETTWLNR